MLSKPLISIVVPTYNGDRYLEKTLNSALAQDYANTEIIVVDDGSQTDVRKIIDKFGDRVRLVSQQNLGPGAARKLGIRESRGEFISLLDHDDLWAPDKISRQASVMMENEHCGLVYCYPDLIDEWGKEIPNTPPSFFPSGHVFEEFIKRNRITTYSATLIRRSALEAVGNIDDSANIVTCDDYDLWLRLSARFEVIFTPGSLVFYRIHPDNLLKNHSTNLEAHLNVMAKCRDFIRDNDSTAQGFDSEKAITQNIFHCYRKFGIIFFYEFPASNLQSREMMKKALELSPGNLSCWIYYIATFQPFVLARMIKRNLSS